MKRTIQGSGFGAAPTLGAVGHNFGGGNRLAEVMLDEADHAQIPLQLRDVEVEVHAIDALDLQSHSVFQNVGHGGGGYIPGQAPVGHGLTGAAARNAKELKEISVASSLPLNFSIQFDFELSIVAGVKGETRTQCQLRITRIPTITMLMTSQPARRGVG